MAVLALLVVWIGFARTYFLAGLFHAPLPNRLLHIHGAVFTLWIILFVSQISLVTTKHVAVHRRLGMYGFGLAVLMLVLGVLAASDQMSRHAHDSTTGTPADAHAFFAIPLGGIMLFATFVALGYRRRNKPAVHKRLMLFATFALLEAAFDRWPIFDPTPLWLAQLISFVPLVLLTMAYDWWSCGRVQNVTIWSAVLLLSVQQGAHPIGHSVAWQHFAAWVEVHTPAF
jgi:hypothetical protein